MTQDTDYFVDLRNVDQAQETDFFADLRSQSPANDPWTPAASPNTEQDDEWQITKGIKAGVDQLQAVGGGLVGIAGDVIGSDRLRDWGLETYQSNIEEAQQHAGRVTTYKDVNDFNDAVDYALYGIGTALPMFVPSLLSGGAGATLVKQAAKKGVESYIKAETLRLTAGGMAGKAAMKMAAKKAARNLAKKQAAGATAAAMAASTGMESGSIYGQINQETGVNRPGVALSFGAIAGSLDALPVMRVLRKFGIGEAAQDAIAKEVSESLGTAIGKQVLMEGGTEALQTVIERSAIKWVDQNREVFSAEGWQEIVDAALIGGMAGGTIGGVSHAVARPGSFADADVAESNERGPVEAPEETADTPPVEEAEPLITESDPEQVEQEVLGDVDDEIYDLEGEIAALEAIVEQDQATRRAQEAAAWSARDRETSATTYVPDEVKQAEDNAENPLSYLAARVSGKADNLQQKLIQSQQPPVNTAMADAMKEALGEDDIDSDEDTVIRPATLVTPTEGISQEPVTSLESNDLKGAPPAETVEETTANPVTPEQPDIDEIAHTAATSPLNDLPEPTDAQKEAGNYKKAHVSVHGLDIAIENPKGSKRSGVDPDGKRWENTIHHHYGYIKRSDGADGDAVDVFIGDNPDSEKVFIVDQVNKDGSFDEHKVMVGFRNKPKAIAGYKKNYDKGWKVGPVTQMTVDQFKVWVKEGNTKEPLSDKLKRQIDDFGERLAGARKDMPKTLTRPLSDDDIAKQPLSKIWPKSDLDKIEDPYVAALATAARQQIPNKPRTRYRIKSWVEKVKTFRSLMAAAIRQLEQGSIDQAEWAKKLAEYKNGSLKDFAAKVNLLSQLERNQWGRIGMVGEHPDSYRYDSDGKQIPTPHVVVEIDKRRHSFRHESVDNALSEVHKKLASDRKPASSIQFEIRGRSGAYKIVKKGDKEYRSLKTFTDLTKAREYQQEHQSDLVEAWEAVKARDNVKKADVRGKTNRPRTGEDYRKGKDVTPEMFSSTFGFRGVQFGNWVKQGKAGRERQGMLNQAYDALMDLANIAKIPPKAVSLEGSLGLAFGARGSGAASAHFEPTAMVINLTKTKGAGTLAHEWFHALDNYLQRHRDDPGAKLQREDMYVTYKPETYYRHFSGHTLSESRMKQVTGTKEADWTKVEGLRPEVSKAFVDLVERLNASPMAQRASILDKGKLDGYWSRIIERAARSFENYVIAKMSQAGYNNDYLANVQGIDEFVRDPGRYPYLLESEMEPIEKAFDKLFDTLKTKETEKGIALYSRNSGLKGKGLPESEISLIVESFLGQYKGADDVKTRIHQYVTTIPGYDPERDQNTSIEAQYDAKSDTVHLVAGNLVTPAAVESALQEEILVHKGLGFFAPQDRHQLYRDIQQAAQQSKAVKKLWKQTESDYRDIADQYNLSSEQRQRFYAEELLGTIAQEKINPLKKGFNKVFLAIKRLLVKAGWVQPSIGMAELRSRVYLIGDAFRRGRRARRRSFSEDIRSPSDVPQFSRRSDDGADSDLDRTALEKIGLTPRSARTLAGKIKALASRNLAGAWENFKYGAYEGAFDGLIGLKRAEDEVGAGIAAGDYAGAGYVGARLATGIADVMSGILHYGAVEWRDGVPQQQAGTIGLMDALSKLDGGINDWLAWMAGHRGEELRQQGRENNLTENDIKVLKSKAKGKEALFEEVRQDYLALNRAMLDFAEGAGLIDPESRVNWESEWYVPFYRTSDIDGDAALLGPRTSRGLSHQSAGIRALKGGDLPTNDLLENILTNWIKLVDSSMKNAALVKAVDNLHGSRFIDNETLRYQQAIVPRSEITKRIKADRNYLEMVADQLGMPDAGELEVLHELEQLDSSGFEKLWAIVAPASQDVVRIQRNGKNEYYKVKDEALLRAVTHLGSTGNNDVLSRTGRWFKRLLTTGVTASPDFIARNFIRDAAHAWAINPDGFKFGRDSIKGLRDAAREDPDYQAMMFAGASFQGGYVHGTDPDASAQIVRRALRAKGLSAAAIDAHMGTVLNTAERTYEAMQTVWQKYREVGDKVENANRLATYKAALEAGKPVAQAVYEAKDLMDYSLRGNHHVMMVLTDIVPFLNARLQGLSKLVRAGRANKRLVAMNMGKIAAASVLLAWLNDDDERYQQLPDWEKDAYWHIFAGESHYRIPKPFEIGILAGTIPERIYHTWVADNQPDEKLLWSINHGLMQTLSFNPIPQAILPVAEVVANRSFFFDAPVEGMSDEGKIPEARYGTHTSETMKRLGDWTGTSPKKLEHLWKGYTGTMGGYVLSLTDIVTRTVTDAPTQPAWGPEDYALVKSFYRGSRPRSTQYHTDFYDRMNEVSELHRTYRAWMKEGRTEDARRLRRENKDKLRFRSALNRAKKQLSTINGQKKRVQRSRVLNAEAKRIKLDQLQAKSNDVARRITELTESAF